VSPMLREADQRPYQQVRVESAKMRWAALAVLALSTLAGCTAKAPTDHVIHVDVRFESADGPPALVAAVGLTLHPQDDQDKDSIDLGNATSRATFHVQDVPSVRIHVQGALGCTTEASDEVFLTPGQRDVDVPIVLYAPRLDVVQTLHFDQGLGSAIRDVPLTLPKGLEQAYLDRLQDGNATATWATDASHEGSFTVGFRLGPAVVWGDSKQAPLNGPARSDVSLGYANARKAAVAGSIAATVEGSDVVAPAGLDVHVGAHLYFVGKGKAILPQGVPTGDPAKAQWPYCMAPRH